MYLYGLGKDGTFLLIKRRDVFGWKVCGWCFSLDVGVITASVQGLRENMFLKSETHNLFLQLPQYLSLRGKGGRGRQRKVKDCCPSLCLIAVQGVSFSRTFLGNRVNLSKHVCHKEWHRNISNMGKVGFFQYGGNRLSPS